MKTYIKCSLLSIITILINLSFFNNAIAQDYIYQIFPEPGASNIGQKPIIKLKTAFKIDTSTFYSRSPYQIEGDSSNFTVYRAKIIIMPTEFIEAPDTIYPMFGLSGYCSVAGDDTINITLDDYLQFNKSYSFRVNNLKLLVPDTCIPPNYDTLRVDTIITPGFTITNQPIHYINSSLDDNSLISPFDTIRINFTEELTNINTPSGNIISIFQDTNACSMHCILSQNHKTIIITPNDSFNIGGNYVIHMNLNKITGDSSDNVLLPFKIRNKASIIVKIIPTDTTIILPTDLIPSCGENKWNIEYNKSATFSCPKTYDNYYLKYYTDADDTTAHIIATNDFVLYINSHNLKDKIIYAEYSRIPIDTLSFENIDTMGTLHVYGFKDSLGNNTYTFSRNDTNFLFIQAIPLPGHKFSYWESSDTTINNSTNTFLNINSKGPEHPYIDGQSSIAQKGKLKSPKLMDLGNSNGNVRPHYDDTLKMWEPCGDAIFCLNIEYLLDNSDPIALDDIIESVTFDGYSEQLDYSDENNRGIVCIPVNSPNPPILPKDFVIKIKDDYSLNYHFFAYFDDKNLVHGGTRFNCPEITTNTITVPLTVPSPGADCQNTLHVYIKKRLCHLTVEEVCANDKNISSDQDVYIDILPRNLKKVSVTRQTLIQDNKKNVKKRTTVYEVEGGQQVQLTPKTISAGTNNGTPYYYYYPGNWSCEPGYTCSNLYNPKPSNLLHANQGQNYLVFTMDGDKTVQQIYDYNFRLEYISFSRSDNTPYFEKFKTNERDGEDPYPGIGDVGVGDYGVNCTSKNVDHGAGLAYGIPSGITHGTYQTHTANIRFHFNKKVIENTLNYNPNNGIYNTAPLYAYEMNGWYIDYNGLVRPDGYENTAYTYSSTENGTKIDDYTYDMLMISNNQKTNGELYSHTIWAVDAHGDKKYPEEHTVVYPGKISMCHLDQFHFEFKKQIHSNDNELSQNEELSPYSFEKITTLPGLLIKNTNLGDIYGNTRNECYGPCEFVAYFMSEYCDMNNIENGATPNCNGFRWPQSDPYYSSYPQLNWDVPGTFVSIGQLKLGHQIEIAYQEMTHHYGNVNIPAKFTDIVYPSVCSDLWWGFYLKKFSKDLPYWGVKDTLWKNSTTVTNNWFLSDRIFSYASKYVHFTYKISDAGPNTNSYQLWGAKKLYEIFNVNVLYNVYCQEGEHCNDVQWIIDEVIGEDLPY